jgi:hypothetical protein
MSDAPPGYPVGYKKPPLHSRFQKGQSGNPEGGRLHRRHDGPLAALLEAALDARMAARSRRPRTRRQAIVVGLVEKSTAGDLGAVKLLLDLVLRAELAAPPPRRPASAKTTRAPSCCANSTASPPPRRPGRLAGRNRAPPATAPHCADDDGFRSAQPILLARDRVG